MVNGVFLIALCVSIFLEAIQRLVEPQEVNKPKFVMIVGCFGLLSNILGLLLFHEHSHGHGGDEAKGEGEADVEQGFARPQQTDSADPRDTAAGKKRTDRLSKGDGPNGSTETPRKRGSQGRSSRRFSSSTGRGYCGVEDIYVHPATMRQDIIAASRNNNSTHFDDEQTSSSDSDQQGDQRPSERSALLRHKDRASNYTDEDGTSMRIPDGPGEEDVHKSHNHAQPKAKNQKGGGHDLNMRGVFLHVMGDALGNIGVIASALIIWLTDWPFKNYVDPGVSLVITIIILWTAIPLCKAASRILLQAVPPGMSIDHIKEDIETLPGVIGSHHLHVWQLSDTKLVASIHIQVDTEIKGEGSERYMLLARQVRKCLHAYGIHSSTIQPEFAPGSDTEDNPGASSTRGSADELASSSKLPSRAASVREGDPRTCLLECDEDCARGGQCCPKKPT